MIHPHTRLAHVSDRIGLGVIATKPIPAGTIVWVRDALDQRIPRSQAETLGPLFRDAIRHFTFWEADGGDLMLCWDHGRYVNHSCEANCLGGGFEFEIAVADIEPGEQLTDDYATFGYASDVQCGCGAPSCRGLVRRSDSVTMAPIWDARLLVATTKLHSVAQPLWPLVMDKATVERAVSDTAALPRHWVA